MENKKNIGILTLLYNANYGGVLQIYALMTYLKSEGYNVKYITRMYPEKNKILKFIRDIAKFIIQKNRKQKLRNKEIDSFFLKNIQPRTKKIWTHSDFRILNKEHFSTIIVGSDQIWRPWFFVEDYFLGFTNDLNYNVRKIAYSASFGVDEWLFDEPTTKKLRQLIKKFDAVSVREKSGIDLCKKYLCANACLTLDPTFLLPPENYISLFEQRKNNTPYIATYILDINEEKSQICEYISLALSLKVNHIQQKENKIRKPISEWLRNIYESDFVITDSFHGTVFSIIFNKPFISIGNAQRGMARFLSLLSLFSLENRIVNGYCKEKIDKIITTPINWDQVNYIKKQLITFSKDYLKKNIQ